MKILNIDNKKVIVKRLLDKTGCSGCCFLEIKDTYSCIATFACELGVNQYYMSINTLLKKL